VATLYAEFLPSSTRGYAILSLSFFWAIGAFFEALLVRKLVAFTISYVLAVMRTLIQAWMVMPSLGWRWLVGLSTLPLFIFVLAAPKYLPESPMYLAVTGRKEAVIAELEIVAKTNGVLAPAGHLVLDEAASRGRFGHLFRKSSRGHGPHLTLSVFYLWFAAAVSYYGVVLITTELLNSDKGMCVDPSVTSRMGDLAEEQECSVHVCR